MRREKYVAKNAVRESKEWFRLKDAKKMFLMGIKKYFGNVGRQLNVRLFSANNTKYCKNTSIKTQRLG